jgi:hypothetical protein
LAVGGLLVERAVARADLQQRPPHCGAHYAHERCVALPACARPCDEHGALTLDQVAAAAEFATPQTDGELARIALGKPPSNIALAARTIVPPTVEGDQALHERRSLSMSWTRGRRELRFSGCLPLEQGAAFEQAIWSIAKDQRAIDKQAGTILEWQQSAADALVTLARCGGADGGVRRSSTTLIVHLSDDHPRCSKVPGR